MARQLRIEFSGGLYHVFSRGNEKRDVFFDDGDRRHFLRTTYECTRRFGVQVLAYCLMPNHYHLFLHTPEPNLSEFMKRLLQLQTQWTNSKYERVGHLFQGRFKSLIVESEGYLLRLSRYIHLNPTVSGMAPRPELYLWSSLDEYLQPDNRRLCSPDQVLARFDSSEAYLDYVYQGIGKDADLMSEVKEGLFLGSDGFVERMKAKLGWEVEPDIAHRRKLLRRTIESILPAVSRERQRIQLYALCEWAGRSQQEVAELFGLTRSGVSQSLRRVRARMERDQGFRSKIEALKARVAGAQAEAIEPVGERETVTF